MKNSAENGNPLWMIVAAIFFGWILGVTCCGILGTIHWAMEGLFGIENTTWIAIPALFISFALAANFSREQEDSQCIRLCFYGGTVLTISSFPLLFEPTMVPAMLVVSGMGGIIGTIFRYTH
jgi:hypothetical protein